MMGGSESFDYLAPSRLGREHARDVRERRLRGRPRDRARRAAPAASSRERLDAPEEVETPGTTTIEALAAAPRHRRGRDVEGAADDARDGTVVLALVRGDDRLEEAKLAGVLRAGCGPSTEDEIRAAFGADPGYLGPVGFDGEIVARRGARGRPVRRRREPDRLAPARRRARARLPCHASPTSASRREGDTCADLRRRARSSRRRSRSGTSSSSARATPRRSMLVSRRRGQGASDRDGELRNRAGSRPRGGRRAERGGGARSAGPPRSRRSTSRSSRCTPRRGDPRARGGARRRSSTRPASTSCSTTATPAPGRSSRTPT